jgi:hypothetical protein
MAVEPFVEIRPLDLNVQLALGEVVEVLNALHELPEYLALLTPVSKVMSSQTQRSFVAHDADRGEMKFVGVIAGRFRSIDEVVTLIAIPRDTGGVETDFAGVLKVSHLAGFVEQYLVRV